MKRIFLTSVLAISMIAPAMAETTTPDIEAGAESATCDSGTLNTIDGTSTLSAQWTANTINLTWYNGETEFTTNTCTYDGGITLPSNEPTRTGYNFAGWQVKQALFDLSTLDTRINGTEYGYTRLNGNTGYKEAEYGLTPGSGEWVAEFSYGTVKGIAKCSAKSGNNHNYGWGGNSADWTAEESELTSASGEARYCWCQPTGYDVGNSGSFANVSASSWVIYHDARDADNCANNCAGSCAGFVMNFSGFRSAVFGVSNN